MIAMLSSFFGGLALLLASVGLYGLMSYSVARRTPEIGLRMALGSPPAGVLVLILKEVTLLLLAGIAVGIPAALAASHVISSMIYGSRATTRRRSCSLAPFCWQWRLLRPMCLPAAPRASIR